MDMDDTFNSLFEMRGLSSGGASCLCVSFNSLFEMRKPVVGRRRQVLRICFQFSI